MNEKKETNNGNGYEFIPEELFVAVNKLGESIKKVDRWIDRTIFICFFGLVSSSHCRVPSVFDIVF